MDLENETSSSRDWSTRMSLPDCTTREEPSSDKTEAVLVYITKGNTWKVEAEDATARSTLHSILSHERSSHIEPSAIDNEADTYHLYQFDKSRG